MECWICGDAEPVLKFFKSIFAAFFLAIPCFSASQNIVVNTFSGLDTQDNPGALQPSQSQDLLNVRLQPGGRSVFKRDGYGLFQTLNSISTAAVHGAYHFQQTSGSNVQLWGSDTGLYASVQDGSFVRVATGTVGGTWQCTDNLGFAYCVTSSGIDTPVKTDGTLANTTYQTGIPNGTIVTSTPLQLVIGGVSGNSSTIYISSNNSFSSFGSGPLPTDPYTEIVNAPGSRITHLAYYFGNIYWWKDQSFGYISGSASQGTVGVTIVSNQIGTLDNSSAFWNPTNYDTGNHFGTGAQQGSPVSNGNPYFNELSSLGGIFFRGQDNHIYQYDGYNLTRLSRMITPNVTASSTRKANFWTQTSQSEFNNGIIVPAGSLSTSISPGDVAVTTFQAIEFSSSQWSNGTSNNLTINPSSITLSTNNSGTINDPGFEGTFSTNYVANQGGISFTSSYVSGCGIGTPLNPHGGSSFMIYENFSSASPKSISLSILDALTGVGISTTTATPASTSGNCSSSPNWTQLTHTDTANAGRRVFFNICSFNGGGTACAKTKSSYIFGGSFSVYETSVGNGSGPTYAFDDVLNGSSTITSGWYTSKVYDTGIASSITLPLLSFTSNTSNPSFALQSSTSTLGVWSTLTTSTGSDVVSNRYVRYTSTLSITSNDAALTFISGATIISVSTGGTYYSSIDNAPNLTSWGSFTANADKPGASSIAYYIRSSTNSFTILSSTPAWISQNNNSNISASTGTFFQERSDFIVTAATENAALHDFTLNWVEGSALDKAYINYFQDAIWFSVSSGSSTATNNVVFYLDLLNSAWLKDNIAANGFLVENNIMYFGDPNSSNIYKYGSLNSDNNSSIQSYWKSMDFTGVDPTTQNEFVQSDFGFAESSTTVSYTYAIDQSTNTTTVLIPLYSSKSSIIKRGFLLPPGKIGTYYNFEVGDNSSSSRWTLIGHRVKYNPLNWNPQVSG